MRFNRLYIKQNLPRRQKYTYILAVEICLIWQPSVSHYSYFVYPITSNLRNLIFYSPMYRNSVTVSKASGVSVREFKPRNCELSYVSKVRLIETCISLFKIQN